MFSPRLETPKKDNPYYIAKSEGGLNPCIPRPNSSKLRFQNCVFYAVGRFAELWGVWLPSTNAENFVSKAKEMGLQIGQTPVLGSIAVWASGAVGYSADGAGHVAVVEIINASGSIVTSESGWSAKTEFWTQTRPDNGNWGQPASYRFLGFVYQPHLDKNPYTEPTRALKKGMVGSDVKWMQWELRESGYLRETEIDGHFGTITLGGLLAFQFEHSMTVDGICGAKTRAMLKEEW